MRATGQQHLLSLIHFPPYRKAAGCRRNVDDKETVGKEGGKNSRPMDFKQTVPVKIGNRREKKGSGKGFQRGKTKGKKGEEMPIFVGFNLFLPLFPLGCPLLAERP